MYHNGMGKETQNQPKTCGVKSEMGKRRASDRDTAVLVFHVGAG